MLNDRLRAVTRKRTLLFLFLTLSVAGGFFAGRHRLAGLVRGATTVEAKAFAANPKAYEGQYIELVGEESFDTGLSKVKGASDKLVWNVVGLLVDDQIVPVKTKKPADKGIVAFKGFVEADSELNNRLLVSSFGRSLATDSTVKLAAFDIDETSFSAIGISIAGVLGLLGLGLFLRQLLKSVHWLTNIDDHPVRQSLTTSGATAEDFAELDGTYAPTTTTKVGKVTLFPNWAVTEKRIVADAFRYSNIVWIYGKRTKQRVNFVPVGSTYSTVVCTADGLLRSLDGRSKNKADDVLTALSQRSPWAAQGFSEDLEAAWKSDKAAFAHAVLSRGGQQIS